MKSTMDIIDKSNTGGLDLQTNGCMYKQGTGSSAGNNLDHNEIKTVKNKRDGCNEQFVGSNDCSYNQATGISITEAGKDDECDEVDIGSNDYIVEQFAGLSPSKPVNLDKNSTVTTNTSLTDIKVNIDGAYNEDLDVGSSDYMNDQHAGVSSSRAEEMHQNSNETSNSRLLVIQPKTFNEEAGRLEPVSTNVNTLRGEQLGDSGDDDEDDHYNRFYFESDHLALKDNKQ